MDLLLNNPNKLKETFSDNPKQVLFERLKLKGMKKDTIYSYIRSIRICLSINPTMNRLQVNKELNFLGWNDFELDYHTLQLAIAYLETEEYSLNTFN